MEEYIVKIVASVLGLIWFFLVFWTIGFRIRKYPKMVESESLFQSLFSFKAGNLFWKEVFNPSHREDKKYQFLIWGFRITTLTFIILGIIWTLS